MSDIFTYIKSFLLQHHIEYLEVFAHEYKRH